MVTKLTCEARLSLGSTRQDSTTCLRTISFLTQKPHLLVNGKWTVPTVPAHGAVTSLRARPRNPWTNYCSVPAQLLTALPSAVPRPRLMQ